MKHWLKIIGIIYSVISAALLPFLLFMQIFSVFLFDSGATILPILISLGILLIPGILIAGNIFLWIAIKKRRMTLAIWSMIIPIVYPMIFFSIWFFIDTL